MYKVSIRYQTVNRYAYIHTMIILFILGHPEAKSLNARLAGDIRKKLERNGHDVRFHDLYRENFDPRLPAEDLRRKCSFDPLVSAHAAELRSAGGLLVVHPDWWGLPPAVVKGWVDRVFLPGTAYAYEDGAESAVPLLPGRKACVVVTRDGAGGSLCSDFWTGAVFPLCGITDSLVVEAGPLRNLTGTEKESLLRSSVVRASSFFDTL